MPVWSRVTKSLRGKVISDQIPLNEINIHPIDVDRVQECIDVEKNKKMTMKEMDRVQEWIDVEKNKKMTMKEGMDQITKILMKETTDKGNIALELFETSVDNVFCRVMVFVTNTEIMVLEALDIHNYWNQSVSSLIFFLFEDSLFVCSTGAAFTKINRFVDYSFLEDVPVKILDPSGPIATSVRPIVGDYSSKQAHTKGVKIKLTDLPLDDVLISFKGIIKQDMISVLFPTLDGNDTESEAGNALPSEDGIQDLHPPTSPENTAQKYELVAGGGIKKETLETKLHFETNVSTEGSESDGSTPSVDGKSVAKAEPNYAVDVGEGRLKFRGGLKIQFSDLITLLRNLNAVYNDEKYYIENSGIRKITKSVPRHIRDEILQELGSDIISVIKGTDDKDSYQWCNYLDVCPKKVDNYANAQLLSISLQKITKDLHGHPSLYEVLSCFRTDKQKPNPNKPNPNKPKANFAQYKNNKKAILGDIQLAIGGDKEYRKLVYFLQGTYVSSKYCQWYIILCGRWYTTSEDFLMLIQKGFQQVLKDHLLGPKDEGYLPKKWYGTDETKYNQSYENLPNYIVGDKKTARYIEYFDIGLKVPETNDHPNKFKAIYLYHVKDTLMQNTRAACSQLHNAAKAIWNLKNIANKPSQDASQFADKFTELITVEEIRNNRCVLVLALRTNPTQDTSETNPSDDKIYHDYQTHEKWRSLKRERDIPHSFTFQEILRDFKRNYATNLTKKADPCEDVGPEVIPDPRKEILETLLKHMCELGYLTKIGENKYIVSSKVLYGTVKEYKVGLPKGSTAYELFLKYRTFYNSLLSKLEIIRLARDMREFWPHIEFKICDIMVDKTEPHVSEASEKEEKVESSESQGTKKETKKSQGTPSPGSKGTTGKKSVSTTPKSRKSGTSTGKKLDDLRFIPLSSIPDLTTENVSRPILLKPSLLTLSDVKSLQITIDHGEIDILNASLPKSSDVSKFTTYQAGWISDVVIDFFLARVINSTQDEDFALPIAATHAFLHSSDGVFPATTLNDEPITWDSQNLNRVFIPFNLNNSHWVLMVFYMKRRQYIYIDPSGSGIPYNQDKKNKILKKIFALTKTSQKDWRHPKPAFFKQENQYDCGPVVASLAYLIKTESPTHVPIDLFDFRSRMLGEIMMNCTSLSLTLDTCKECKLQCNKDKSLVCVRCGQMAHTSCVEVEDTTQDLDLLYVCKTRKSP